MKMAYSLLSKLEEKVTCPVCLDLYKDPKELVCRHTICTQCMARLAKGFTILCPQCRHISHISKTRTDFRMNELLDMYKSQRFASDHAEAAALGEKAVVGLACVLCTSNYVKMFCNDCETPLCIECVRSHCAANGKCMEKNAEDIGLWEMKTNTRLEQQVNKIKQKMIRLNRERKKKIHSSADRTVALSQKIQCVYADVETKVKEHFYGLMDDLSEMSQREKEELAEFYESLIHDLEQNMTELQGAMMSDITVKLHCGKEVLKRSSKVVTMIEQVSEPPPMVRKQFYHLCPENLNLSLIAIYKPPTLMPALIGEPLDVEAHYSQAFPGKLIRLIRVAQSLVCLTDEQIFCLNKRNIEITKAVMLEEVAITNATCIAAIPNGGLVVGTKHGLYLFSSLEFPPPIMVGEVQSVLDVICAKQNGNFRLYVLCLCVDGRKKRLWAHEFAEQDGVWTENKNYKINLHWTKEAVVTSALFQDHLHIAITSTFAIYKVANNGQVAKSYKFNNDADGPPTCPIFCQNFSSKVVNFIDTTNKCIVAFRGDMQAVAVDCTVRHIKNLVSATRLYNGTWFIGYQSDGVVFHIVNAKQ